MLCRAITRTFTGNGFARVLQYVEGPLNIRAYFKVRQHAFQLRNIPELEGQRISRMFFVESSNRLSSGRTHAEKKRLE